jgi:hypothetical protein
VWTEAGALVAMQKCLEVGLHREAAQVVRDVLAQPPRSAGAALLGCCVRVAESVGRDEGLLREVLESGVWGLEEGVARAVVASTLIATALPHDDGARLVELLTAADVDVAALDVEAVRAASRLFLQQGDVIGAYVAAVRLGSAPTVPQAVREPLVADVALAAALAWAPSAESAPTESAPTESAPTESAPAERAPAHLLAKHAALAAVALAAANTLRAWGAHDAIHPRVRDLEAALAGIDGPLALQRVLLH